jgi:hypothetical protein
MPKKALGCSCETRPALRGKTTTAAKHRARHAKYMAALSDTQLARNLCYIASQRAPTDFGRRVDTSVLAEDRAEAKRRGWSPKRIRRAETCKRVSFVD